MSITEGNVSDIQLELICQRYYSTYMENHRFIIIVEMGRSVVLQ